MRRKNFELGKGKYYFNILSGPQKVTIHRTEKHKAIQTYQSYIRLGKDCEWLGMWDGQKFQETSEPVH